MNKIFHLLLLMLVSGACFTACNNEDTYADRRNKENQQINNFLTTGATIRLADNVLLSVPGNIKVISEQQFYAQDSTTDLTKNEYVLFAGSGVYMQILRKGTGEKIKSGERVTLLSRYIEYNIASDTLLSTNRTTTFATIPDVLNVVNNSGTFTASFVSGLMRSLYAQSTPSGWLAPLPFIRVGRQDSSADEIAKVRLILPSTEGQTQAYNNVYPCFYELTYQRSR